MVGEKIRDLRHQKGMSQMQFARLLNVSQSAIGMWETNQRSLDAVKLLEISKIFNVSIDWLLEEEGKSKVIEVKIPKASNAVTFIDKKGNLATYIISDDKINVIQAFVKALSEASTSNKKK